MGWSRRQNPPPNDPDAGNANDPLADNMRLRPRRSLGGTQPINSDIGGSIHDQNTVVESGNFSSRTQARRERQISSPFSTQRIGSWAANPENSQKLLMIGAAVVAFLLLVAFISIAGRFYSTGDTPNNTTDALPSASAEIGGIITEGPAASIDTGTAAQPATNIPGTDPGQQPPVGVAAFTVSGTASEGLFLRQDHNSAGQVLGTLPEGTRVESLGETFNDGTRDWLKVRAPIGEGWVAQQYLQPTQ